MQLLYGKLSPFTRKVVVFARETGLLERLELVPSPLSAVDPNEAVMAANPLGKIPTLVMDDGQPLFDSPVICEYLDTLHGGRALIPTGNQRWQTLRLNAAADGLLEAGILYRTEGTRPEGQRWEAWSKAQLRKVENTLGTLERDAAELRLDEPLLGEIAVGCALGWLDFRLPQLARATNRPALARWYATFSQRPSMLATAPA